jgi:hypothetical protein
LSFDFTSFTFQLRACGKCLALRYSPKHQREIDHMKGIPLIFGGGFFKIKKMKIDNEVIDYCSTTFKINDIKYP